jgi:hypothetical protein
MVPNAFKKLCGYLHQDIGEDGSTPDEWIAFAQRHLSDQERATVHLFLKGLLDRPVGDRDLQDIWFSSGAEIYFPDASYLRGVLALMRDSVK